MTIHAEARRHRTKAALAQFTSVGLRSPLSSYQICPSGVRQSQSRSLPLRALRRGGTSRDIVNIHLGDGTLRSLRARATLLGQRLNRACTSLQVTAIARIALRFTTGPGGP